MRPDSGRSLSLCKGKSGCFCQAGDERLTYEYLNDSFVTVLPHWIRNFGPENMGA